MNKIPSWDLTDLFSSVDDEAIGHLIARTTESAKSFREKYHGHLSEYAETKKFLAMILQYEDILSDAVRPQVFGELISSVDSIDAKKGAFLQKSRAVTAEIFSELIFVELEIVNFPEEKLQKMIVNKELAKCKHFLEKLLAWKNHRLSEKEEQLSQMKDLTGRQAFVRLFEQELSAQKFKMEIDGQGKELAQSEILNILYANGSQEVRAKAAEVFTQGLLSKKELLTFIMNILAEDKKISDKLHGFSFPEQSRHLTNEASPEAVEAMAEAVEESFPLVQDYYKFKKEVLGLEKIYDYDRYAPVGSIQKKYSFEEAKKIVLDAFGYFDKSFADIAEKFFEKRWIDAPVGKGKRGGAYCECATPSMHPYVFMNFTGSVNDVMTLAHELGHAINFELARKQTLINFDLPLTLAETASILAETLVFEKMVADTNDKKDLLSLYMQKIESIFAAVHRQLSMYRFEQDFHNVYRENGELSTEQINNLWRNRQEKMFDESVELSGGYDNWWMYISHFIHTPFYVYAYAFGELLAFGFLKKSKENHGEFVRNYTEFLETAGSKSPQEMAAKFGINLEDEEFWKSGLQTIAQYLDKAKKLHSENNR